MRSELPLKGDDAPLGREGDPRGRARNLLRVHTSAGLVQAIGAIWTRLLDSPGTPG